MESAVQTTAEISQPPSQQKTMDPLPKSQQMAFKSTSDSCLTVDTFSKPLTMLKSKSEGLLLAICSLDNAPLHSAACDADGCSGDEAASIHSSVHDYENLAALNVNRADWGIRHWKSYSDIENSFHDNSVCKV